MIKLKTFLDNRGYYETRWGYVRVFRKTIYNSNHDKLAQIYVKFDEIRVSLFFPKELEKEYKIMWPQIKNYLKDSSMDDITLRGNDIFLKKSASINNNLSNKYANILTDFLDKWENIENISRIHNDITNIVNNIDNSDEGKTYKELIDFLKSKDFKVEEYYYSTTAKQTLSTNSYNYSLCVNKLLSDTFELTITVYNAPYKDLLSPFLKKGRVLFQIDKALWSITNAQPFSPVGCLMRIDGGENNYSINVELGSTFPFWNDKERIDFIHTYINTFTDPSTTEEFLDLFGETLYNVFVEEDL